MRCKSFALSIPRDHPPHPNQLAVLIDGTAVAVLCEETTTDVDALSALGSALVRESGLPPLSVWLLSGGYLRVMAKDDREIEVEILSRYGTLNITLDPELAPGVAALIIW